MTACILGIAACSFVLGGILGIFIMGTLTANRKPLPMPEGNADKPTGAEPRGWN